MEKFEPRPLTEALKATRGKPCDRCLGCGWVLISEDGRTTKKIQCPECEGSGVRKAGN